MARAHGRVRRTPEQHRARARWKPGSWSASGRLPPHLRRDRLHHDQGLVGRERERRELLARPPALARSRVPPAGLARHVRDGRRPGPPRRDLGAIESRGESGHPRRGGPVHPRRGILGWRSREPTGAVRRPRGCWDPGGRRGVPNLASASLEPGSWRHLLRADLAREGRPGLRHRPIEDRRHRRIGGRQPCPDRRLLGRNRQGPVELRGRTGATGCRRRDLADRRPRRDVAGRLALARRPSLSPRATSAGPRRSSRTDTIGPRRCGSSARTCRRP